MDIKQKITVLRVARYNFDDDGKTVRGCKVTYKGDLIIDEKDKKGVELPILPANYEMYDVLGNVFPCDVEASMTIKMISNKPTLFLSSAKLLAKAS
ncbi:MAG: hypothetical protein AAF827_14615 [Cyanobacteria bacterium P01_D01_bin.6]